MYQRNTAAPILPARRPAKVIRLPRRRKQAESEAGWNAIFCALVLIAALCVFIR